MAVDFNANQGISVTKNQIVTLATILSSLLLFGILYALLIMPVQKRTHDIAERYRNIAAVNLNATGALESQRDELLMDKQETDHRYEAVKAPLTATKDISNLLDKFIETARKRRLEFTYIKPLQQQPSTFQSSEFTEETVRLLDIPVSMQLEAGFEDFLLFLWDMEHIDNTLQITRLAIERQERQVRHREYLEMKIIQLEQDGQEQ